MSTPELPTPALPAPELPAPEQLTPALALELNPQLLLQNLLDHVASAIEAEIGEAESMAPKDSPYRNSLIVAYRKRLQAAAAAAITTIVAHPLLAPTPTPQPSAGSQFRPAGSQTTDHKSLPNESG